ncbi:ImmA/IrrE family metallo-endopeptidase [Moraxella atlantae]|uniref:Domain of uncharacterized function (DUF955) n=1 Tax=Faucicola atlantae TaxID=34059 RepID=A0A378QL83_9GAMM|nr:ImmA/IrrE family metallo-endopeptidase [Moraxella atlantae]OPH35641.1 hypothetical protein B5J92_04760 [Moraxella atlantae]STZ01626.1 Domain of uncharacterised function (DUF955) [Moraxella atlantae]
MRNIRISSDLEIEALASQILQDNSLYHLPVDIFQLAKILEINLVPYPNAEGGIMGMLIRNKNDFTIIYSTRINNVGLHRFTIAHEIGHYFLPEHVEQAIKDGQHISNSKYKPWYEIEADYFASCLLMPKKFFKSEMSKFPDGLDAILALSQIFNTSITATAIRYAELADFPISVVFSTDDIVDFAKHSKLMFKLGRKLVMKGSQIPANSKSSAIYTPNMLYKLPISLDIWCDCEAKINGHEIYINLGEYQKRLTVITSDYDPDDCQEFKYEWEPPKFK